MEGASSGKPVEDGIFRDDAEGLDALFNGLGDNISVLDTEAARKSIPGFVTKLYRYYLCLMHLL